MDETAIAVLLRDAYERLAKGDPTAVLNAFAHDGALHITSGAFTGDHVGPEAIAQLLGGLVEWTLRGVPAASSRIRSRPGGQHVSPACRAYLPSLTAWARGDLNPHILSDTGT